MNIYIPYSLLAHLKGTACSVIQRWYATQDRLPYLMPKLFANTKTHAMPCICTHFEYPELRNNSIYSATNCLSIYCRYNSTCTINASTNYYCYYLTSYSVTITNGTHFDVKCFTQYHLINNFRSSATSFQWTLCI